MSVKCLSAHLLAVCILTAPSPFVVFRVQVLPLHAHIWHILICVTFSVILGGEAL